MAEAVSKYPSLQGLSADAGYRKSTEYYVREVMKKRIEISQRVSTCWSILPQRWVVERTFGWLNSYRRLSKDYERSIESARNTIMIAHTMLLLKRLYNP